MATLLSIFQNLLGIGRLIEEVKGHFDKRMDAAAVRLDAIRGVVESNHRLLGQILRALIGEATKVQFNATFNGQILKGVTVMDFKVGQKFSVSPTFEDDAGNPAQVESLLGYEVSPPGTVDLAPHDTDPMGTVVLHNGTVASCQLTGRFDARFGEEVREIVGILDINALSGEATLVRLNPGPVEDQ